MNKRLFDLLHDRYLSTAGLTRELTVQEAESRYAVRIDGEGADPVPFGFLGRECQKLLRRIQPGDELWEFRAVRPRGETIDGVKLIRDSVVIDAIVAGTNNERAEP